ncbi:MAG: hypothetical protein ABFD98_05030 [Syntrophobacteraceae bacterium]
MNAEMFPIDDRLRSVLEPAYGPCSHFAGACREMRWDPDSGHTPRGFCGATGRLEEVQLIFVFAEPGNPHQGESHQGIESTYSYAYQCFEQGKDQFHRNVRRILDLCWPSDSFEAQMHHVWLTNSVLCSARKEGGHVHASSARTCLQRYLLNQLALFPGVPVVALGFRAQHRLRGLANFISAHSAAPPGCNKLGAKESWHNIAERVHTVNLR